MNIIIKNKFIFTYRNKFFTTYSQTKDSLLKKFHPSQSKTMNEELILVDTYDNVISSISKIDGHLKSALNKHPHRAFSVFLFNNENKLLLQKRASSKVTFPNLWSNTCCSHPLNIENERKMEANFGIKTAAVRRMQFEFGVNTQISDYSVIEKILYRADSDDTFEEFELDYILISKKDFELDFLKRVMNPDEVSDAMYLGKEELRKLINENSIKVTPWFKLVIQNKLDDIYDFLENKSNKVGKDKNISIILNYI